jgi:protein gp37
MITLIQADKRIPQLLQVPAKVRFLSMEPQLEEIDLSKWLDKGIHWVIQGGESGGRARTFNLTWARKTRDQCKEAGVSYFLKQLGSKPVGLSGEPMHISDSHGGEMREWPVGYRVREIPEVVG